MKRLILTVCAGVFAALGLYAADSDGHELEALWKTYYDAVDADRPKKAADALTAVKTAAKKQHLCWDFYDACLKYRSNQLSVNWKLRDSLDAQFAREVESFGEPVVQLYYYLDQGKKSAEEMLAFVKSNEKALRRSCNPVFHRNSLQWSCALMLEPLLKTIDNDYLYGLWAVSLWNSHRTADTVCPGRKELAAELGGAYPAAAFLEFLDADQLRDSSAREAAMKAYARKYKGKAVSYFALQALLNIEFGRLNSSKTSTSKDFVAFRGKCDQQVRELKAMSGADAAIVAKCDMAATLIKTMDATKVSYNIKDGKLTISTRNLSEVKVLVDTSEVKTSVGKIWKTTLKNPVQSYYVLDTITVDVPDFHDGYYKVSISGTDCEVTSYYERYSISLAMRRDSKGVAAYAADFMTGEPVSKVDMVLYSSGKVIGTAKGVALKGYTPLPSAIAAKAPARKSFTLDVSYRDARGIVHRSKKTYVPSYVEQSYTASDGKFGLLFLNCGAFVPGDTVAFKGVAYHGDPSVSYSALGAGKTVRVDLYDPQNKKIASKDLRTNEFGSVAGEFVLPELERNGLCHIAMSYSGQELQDAWFQVGDFVFPTYELKFDKVETLYMCGDMVRIGGVLRAYSGHSLTNANVSYTVSGNAEPAEGRLEIGTDGRFEIKFLSKTSDYSNWHNITVKVVDATGETKEFSTSLTVRPEYTFSVELEGEDECSFVRADEPRQSASSEDQESSGTSVLSADEASAAFSLNWSTEAVSGANGAISISYKLLDPAGKSLLSGSAAPGDKVAIDLSGKPSGMYALEARVKVRKASGDNLERKYTRHIYRVSDADAALEAEFENFYRPVRNGSKIGLQIGTTVGAEWICAELFGHGGKCYGSQIIKLEGEIGKDGSLRTVSWDWKDGWDGELLATLLYFRKGRCYTYQYCFHREDSFGEDVPELTITRLVDKAVPGEKVSVGVKASSAAEIVAAVFDKSTEVICANRWSRPWTYRRGEPYVNAGYSCGSDNADGSDYEAIPFQLSNDGRKVMMAKSAARSAGAVMAVEECDELCVEEESVNAAMKDDSSVQEEYGAAADMVAVRENFANVLTFQPFVRPSADGSATVDFQASDKLSTYYVQLFAHEKTMRSAVLRQEFKVTLPLKVSLVEPQYLYVGDRYDLKANVSNIEETDMDGSFVLQVYDRASYKDARVLKIGAEKVSVPAGGAASASFTIDVPEGVDTLGLKLTFLGKDGALNVSDAVFVAVPVYPAVQTLTEAHSAVLLDGADKEALVAQLRSRFVNTSSYGAEYSEISVLDMVRDAIPSVQTPDSDNAIALVNAIYANRIAAGLKADSKAYDSSALMAKLLKCRNSDGGFGWFAGMDSSPVVTAFVLLRLGVGGELTDTMVQAVRYLDRAYFSGRQRPYWCGGLSMDHYLFVRAKFASVEFTGKTTKAFRKALKEYLTPSAKRGFNGCILAKARRLRILMDLSGSAEGMKLCRAWGGPTSASKLTSSLKADLASLKEYAVENDGNDSGNPNAACSVGGIYFPNAFLYRGIFEGELYAHVFLCDIFSQFGAEGDAEAARIADGIRLWMMLQKETQQWGGDPAFVDALAAVLEGSQAVLNTRVILMKKTFEKPFAQIRAAGNGFTVETEYWLEGAKKPLAVGDELSVGDKIIAHYKIWNEENRSFVRLRVPRPASLRPVEQVSGRYGWWLRPLSVSGWYSFSPQGYRSVKAAATEYWFDSYPEEKTTVTEAFYVTQAGRFSAPACEIESLYAPHYRANGSGQAPLASR